MKKIADINANACLYEEHKYRMVLECHPTFLQISDKFRNAVVNGCGPGSWKYNCVPNRPAGFDFVWTCNGHDWDYFLYGLVAELGVKGKMYADIRARHNWGSVVIQMPKPWWVPGFFEGRWRRHCSDIPQIYYLAVKNLGNGAYFKATEEMKQVMRDFGGEINALGLRDIKL